MTRQLLGLVALDAVLVAVGWTVLRGAGLARTGAQAWRDVALALVVGWAATGVALSLALALGAPFRWSTIAAAWIVIAAAGLAAARIARPRPEIERPAESGLARVAGVGGAAGVAVLLVVFLVRSEAPTGVLYVDVWNFWIPKAQSIFFSHTLATGPGGYTAFENPDYPPFYPSFAALTFRFIGGVDLMRLPLEHAVIGAAFVLALATLLRRRVRPAILWPGLLLVGLMPMFEQLIGSTMADEPLAALVALAGVTGTLWLLEGEGGYAALTGLFLAAAALTKNEGLMLGISLLVALALSAGRPKRPALNGLLAIVPPVLAFLVWKAWLSRHGVPSSSHYRFSDLLHPEFLAHRISRLTTATGGILKQALHPQKTLWAIPLALALSALAGGRRVALVAPITAVLSIAGYCVIYWISPIDVHFYLKAAPRIVTAPVLLCAALLPLLLEEATHSRRSGGRSPSPAA